MADNVRAGLLVRTCLEVLRDAHRPLTRAATVDAVAGRIDGFSEYERAPIDSGRVRWVNMLQWPRI